MTKIEVGKTYKFLLLKGFESLIAVYGEYPESVPVPVLVKDISKNNLRINIMYNILFVAKVVDIERTSSDITILVEYPRPIECYG